MACLRKINRFILLIAVFTTLTGTHLYAQGEQREIKKIDWNKVTNGEQFLEKSKEEKEPKESSEREDDFFTEDDSGEGITRSKRSEGSSFNPFGGNTFFDTSGFEIFAIILLIAIAIYLLILFLKNRPKNPSVKADNLADALMNAEDDIDKSDLRYLLQLALDQNNLKAALRIYYLLIIKELNKNNLIQYKKDKTNYNYVLEMIGQPELEDFKKLTFTYEYHWYGDNELNHQRFNLISPAIEKFLGHLKSKYPEDVPK